MIVEDTNTKQGKLTKFADGPAHMSALLDGMRLNKINLRVIGHGANYWNEFNVQLSRLDLIKLIGYATAVDSSIVDETHLGKK